jgi:hypothetical protein
MAKYIAECSVALWRGADGWEEVCDSRMGYFDSMPPDLVRTTHDMLQVRLRVPA